MKVIGLDLGNRTVGIAISDYLGIIANPIGTFRFDDCDLDTALELVVKTIKENKVEKIVLGLPKNMDGTEGIQAETSKMFKEMLEKATNLEVELFDERLTSRVALNSMIMGGTNKKDRHDQIDEMAAKIILQDYLDKIRR